MTKIAPPQRPQRLQIFMRWGLNTEVAPTYEVPVDLKGVNQENPNDGEVIKRDDQPNTVQPLDTPTPATGEKKTMVAEPSTKYSDREPLSSRIIIGGCGATPPRGFRAAGRKL